MNKIVSEAWTLVEQANSDSRVDADHYSMLKMELLKVRQLEELTTAVNRLADVTEGK